MRINATPSDLPFKFTGFAMYPVPPQFGQSSGSTPLPLSVEGIFSDSRRESTEDCFALRNPNKISQVGFLTQKRGREPALLSRPDTRPRQLLAGATLAGNFLHFGYIEHLGSRATG